MKVQNPIIGRARGSAGGMTFAKNYDKNVARAKAFEVANPKTAAQQNQRGFFASVSEMTADFSADQLRSLFPQKPKAMSRRNALTKQIAGYTTTDNGAKVVDFANIDTIGGAPVMDFGTTTCTYSNSQLVVTLDQSVSNLTEFADNYFIALLVNVTKKELYLGTTSAKVSTGTFNAVVPSSWAPSTDTIHAIPLITDSKAAIVGFGSMSVTKRPVKK